MTARWHSTSACYTVVYDGECRVCSRLASALRARDRQHVFEVIPFQVPGIQTRFAWITPQEFRTSLQLVGAGGERWQGVAAVEQILKSLPRARWIAWLFRIPFARPLADRLYRWFASNRDRLGCTEHCSR